MKRLTVIAAALALLAFVGFAAACGADNAAVAVEDAPAETGAATTPETETTEPDATAPTTTAANESEERISYEIWLTQGDGLVPVGRTHEYTQAVGRAALEDLLAGPSASERAEGFSTTIPEGTQLLGLNIADGVATVDLSSEFETGGGTQSMLGRLGQVTCTLTQFPTVDGVRFHLDGEPVHVFSGEGIIIDDLATCEHYSDFLPVITVDTPHEGDEVASPVTVSGTANVFEANVTVKVLDASGREIASTFTTATCGTGCRGDYSVAVKFDVDRRQRGTIVVHDDDAAGTGQPPHIVRIPVTLLP